MYCSPALPGPHFHAPRSTVSGVRATCSAIPAAHADAVLQRQHDGAHHGDQKDHAGSLEEIDVAGVEHEADRLGVRNFGRNRRGDRLRHAGPDRPGADHQQQFGEKNPADQHADRQILQHALLELGKIDVEHHDDEQEQHRDRADIDHDQDHGEEFGAHHHEQTRPR